jgi:hypothetical protein
MRTCGNAFPGMEEPGGVCEGVTSLMDGVRIRVLMVEEGVHVVRIENEN